MMPLFFLILLLILIFFLEKIKSYLNILTMTDNQLVMLHNILTLSSLNL